MSLSKFDFASKRHEDCLKRIKCECDDMSNPCSPTIITESDINEASAKSINGFVIKKSGKYKVCGKVNWINNTDFAFAITLKGKRITLEFDDAVLKQKNVLAQGCFGIQIAGTAKYIQIKNASFQNCSGGTVFVQSGASFFSINGIKSNSCSFSGPIESSDNGLFEYWISSIFLNGGIPGGDTTPTISNGIITNCEFNHNGIYGVKPVSFVGSISGSVLTLTTPPLEPINVGFTLTDTSGNIPTGVTIVSVLSTTTYQISASLSVASEAMVVSDPSAIYNAENNIINTPINISSSKNITILNCISNQSFGNAGSFGFNFIESLNIYASDLIYNDISTFEKAKLGWVASCDDVTIEKLHVNGITTYVAPSIFTVTEPSNFYTSAEGLKLSSTNTIVRKCTFNGLSAQLQTPLTPAYTAVPSAVGIISLVNSSTIVDDCIFSDIDATVANAVVLVALSTQNTFTNCKARNITSANGSAVAFGEYPSFGVFPGAGTISGNSFDNCSVDGVSITGGTNYAAAFVLSAASGKVTNCTMNNVRNQSGESGSAAYGVVLENGLNGQATSCVVKGNTITNCDTAGISDMSSSPSNLISGNYMAFNGPGGAGPNAIGLTAATQSTIQDWPILTGPTAVPPCGSVIANVSVHN